METRGLQRFIRCFQLLPQRPMDRRQAGSSWTPRQRTHVDQMWTRVPQMGSAGPAKSALYSVLTQRTQNILAKSQAPYRTPLQVTVTA